MGFDDIVADIHREYQSTIATEPPPRLPESPQRGESKAAHDLDDEREKQCDANATVERKQTTERGEERLLKRIGRRNNRAPLQVPASAPWSEHQAARSPWPPPIHGAAQAPWRTQFENICCSECFGIPYCHARPRMPILPSGAFWEPCPSWPFTDMRSVWRKVCLRMNSGRTSHVVYCSANDPKQTLQLRRKVSVCDSPLAAAHCTEESEPVLPQAEPTGTRGGASTSDRSGVCDETRLVFHVSRGQIFPGN